jgi:hypothetical protein
MKGEPRARLIQAFAGLSRLADRLEITCGDQLACRNGCDECCRETVWLRGVEAAYLLEGARELLGGAVSLVWNALETARAGCPLSHGGVCLVEEQRPVACRTRGLPMVRRQGEETVLHHCPRNFHDLDPTRLPSAVILDEARLAVLLDAVDALYCLQSGWSGDVVRIDELLRAGLRP